METVMGLVILMTMNTMSAVRAAAMPVSISMYARMVLFTSSAGRAAAIMPWILPWLETSGM